MSELHSGLNDYKIDAPSTGPFAPPFAYSFAPLTHSGVHEKEIECVDFVVSTHSAMVCLFTGLPKAAVMRQQRYYLAHFAMTKAFNVTPDDVVYCCLPLYHAAGNYDSKPVIVVFYDCFVCCFRFV